MLFTRKKYNYFNIILLYIKIVPSVAVAKIIYNLINSVTPTLNILLTAMFINNAVEIVNNQEQLINVILPLVAIILIKLFNYYFSIIIDLINTKATNKIRKTITPALAEKRAKIKYKYYENQETVDLIDRVTKEFEKNIEEFFNYVFNILVIAAQIVGFVIILGMQLWWTSFIFAFTCIPSVVVSYKLGKKRYTVDKDMTKINRKVDYLLHILTSRDTIEERYMYGFTKKLNEDYKINYDYARLERKKVSKSWWFNTTLAGIITFISGVFVISFLIPIAVFPDSNGIIKLSIGMFISLVGAILGLSQQMQENIPDYIYKFSYQFEYLKDLNNFLQLEEALDAICLPNTKTFKINSVEFKNVNFKYPNCETYILKNFNVKLSADKHYSIVGENGAGKTTITKILTGLYDNYEGEILINNKELRQYSQSEIKAISSVVYQDFCHYPLNFYKNIAIGNINDINNNKKVEEAVDVIGLTATVNTLPQKYETSITKINESGIDLSGGQWQKIALSRLLINPAPLKILDEPTSALDPISESRVYEQFDKIINQNKEDCSNKITIFISHRLASTKLSDEIIVISEGKVAEMGTFEQLMLNDGIYAKMFNIQSKWYTDEKDSGEENE